MRHPVSGFSTTFVGIFVGAFVPYLFWVASRAQVVVRVHLAESDGAEKYLLVVVFEDLSHWHEIEQSFSADAGDLFDRQGSIFKRNSDSTLESFLSLAPVFTMQWDGVERQHIAVEFFELFCRGCVCAESFLEQKCCVEDEVGEDDSVSFPSTHFHFVLEVGFFERVVGEFSHARVAVGVSAFLRDVGCVVVEEAYQLFARRDRTRSALRGKPTHEPLR